MSKVRHKRKRKKLGLSDISLIVCIVVLIVSVCGLGADILSRVDAARQISKIQKINPLDDIRSGGGVSSGENLKILQTINDDIVAWIEIADTNISMPVVQGTNNSFYLNRTFTKEYNAAGSIFMDYENKADFTDQNTVIYGHARLDKTMFGSLSKLKKQDFFNTHQIITIVTSDSVYYYRIFSINVVKDTYDYRSSDYGSEFPAFVKKLRSSSVITSKASVSADSRIITLSTCTDAIKNGRLAVFGVLLNPNGEQIDLSQYSAQK